MFDYAAWTIRCGKFVQSLRNDERATVRADNGAVLELPTSEDFAKIESRIARRLPRPLLEFSEVFGGLAMWYSWRPTRQFRDEIKRSLGHTNLYGGPRQFAVTSYLWQWWDRTQEWATQVKAIGSKRAADFDVWHNALPILCIPNGDFLALDLRHSSDDPPVVYLSHDDDFSPEISPSLETFLNDWEQLCYIGPEIWMLEDFGAFRQGMKLTLDTQNAKADELRRILLKRSL